MTNKILSISLAMIMISCQAPKEDHKESTASKTANPTLNKTDTFIIEDPGTGEIDTLIIETSINQKGDTLMDTVKYINH
jgi:hypothetical protein